MSVIKAIQTKYKGHLFRSRLEARWAIVFDQLDLKWNYEPEGFNLSSGPYLPDFWIEDWSMYVEIKPTVDDWPELSTKMRCFLDQNQ